MKSAVDDKMDLLYNSPNQFVDALMSLTESIIKVDDDAVRRKTMKLSQLIGETMALADALGRKRLLMEIDAKSNSHEPPHFRSLISGPFTFMTTPIVPKVPFKEAFEDILRREPRLAKSRDEIARAYSGDNGFAIMKLPVKLAEEARLRLLKRVQKALADFAAKGNSAASAAAKVASMGDFTRAYAENIYRTNLATAFTAGRMRQMKDRDVQDVTPAFEFDAVRDKDTTVWCKHTHGLLAAINNPVWDRYSPPLHWQCRSDLRAVDKYELKERGLLSKVIKHALYPPGIKMGGPAPGFRVERTDKRIYGFKAGHMGDNVLRPWMIYEGVD